jgi:lysophospholipase
MAYTASSLSFMLENLGKTVILTGSQIPLQELRNDAIDNFLGSLIVAANYKSLYFIIGFLKCLFISPTNC